MFLFIHCVRLARTEFLEENSYYSNKTAPQTFPTAHKQHQIRTYLQLNEFCDISSSGCLNMKVYCTNTCHDISQYLAMERLHPGKKNQIFSGIDRCYNKQFILDLDEEIHFWTFVEQDFMFMINFCWDLDCPKQKVIRGVFSSCKTKNICTFFGNMFFESDCYGIV